MPAITYLTKFAKIPFTNGLELGSVNSSHKFSASLIAAFGSISALYFISYKPISSIATVTAFRRSKRHPFFKCEAMSSFNSSRFDNTPSIKFF